MALDLHRKHLDCHSKLSPRRLQGRRSLTYWSESIESYQDFTHWVAVWWQSVQVFARIIARSQCAMIVFAPDTYSVKAQWLWLHRYTYSLNAQWLYLHQFTYSGNAQWFFCTDIRTQLMHIDCVCTKIRYQSINDDCACTNRLYCI